MVQTLCTLHNVTQVLTGRIAECCALGRPLAIANSFLRQKGENGTPALQPGFILRT